MSGKDGVEVIICQFTVNIIITVEPRYNEPLYNEVLGITNDILYLSNRKIYGKEPWYKETLL